MVMFELLTGLAPATADASRRGGLDLHLTESILGVGSPSRQSIILFILMGQARSPGFDMF